MSEGLRASRLERLEVLRGEIAGLTDDSRHDENHAHVERLIAETKGELARAERARAFVEALTHGKE